LAPRRVLDIAEAEEEWAEEAEGGGGGKGKWEGEEGSGGFSLFCRAARPPALLHYARGVCGYVHTHTHRDPFTPTRKHIHG